MAELPGSFWRFATSRPVVQRAAAMALIVGPIIALINYGDMVVSGEMTRMEWIKVAITFLVPYTVSTVSSALAIRHPLKHAPKHAPNTPNA